METERKVISPIWYYMFISSLTNLAFIAVGIIAFALCSIKLPSIAAIIITILLILKGMLVGIVTGISQRSSNKKEFAVNFIGRYLGRFFGLLIGGFLGARIANMLGQANILGFFVGALALFFVGQWLGSKVSGTIGSQLDKVFSIKEPQEPEKVIEAKLPKRPLLVLFIVIIQLLLAVIGLLINYYDIPIGYLVELLPIARIIVIAIFIFSFCYPWLMRNRWLKRFQSSTPSAESVTFLLGLTVSAVPAIYGLFLLIFMGASIIELFIFTITSSIVTIIWSIHCSTLEKQKAS